MPKALDSEISVEESVTLLVDFQQNTGLLKDLDQAELTVLAEQLSARPASAEPAPS